jgi:hypothetical protein
MNLDKIIELIAEQMYPSGGGRLTERGQRV